MDITILGAGAMGSLFGGYLSERNRVWLVDVNPDRVNRINAHGIRIREADGDRVFFPTAVTSAEGLRPMDLIIVFVKAMSTVEALAANRRLIGENTFLMTLQNGTGHEEKLLRFADKRHVVIGTTQHNSSIIENGYVNHGGGGQTFIGALEGGCESIAPIAENLTACGFECFCSDDVQKQIWNKLFLNASASALTGILQVPLGFILEDQNARFLMERLVHEAVSVANGEGHVCFDEAEVLEGVCAVLENAKNGYTSIYADIRNGVRSEVDTISGSVAAIAERLGIPVPYHRAIIALIHAMESRVQSQIQ